MFENLGGDRLSTGMTRSTSPFQQMLRNKRTTFAKKLNQQVSPVRLAGCAVLRILDSEIGNLKCVRHKTGRSGMVAAAEEKNVLLFYVWILDGPGKRRDSKEISKNNGNERIFFLVHPFGL